MHVSEYGVEEDESGKVHRCPTEEGVYEVLGLPYIEPELREGRGELQAAIARARCRSSSPRRTCRGDLHCHTTLSDGRSSLEDMARAAQARGYEYLAVTDHSASHGFGNDVQADELLRQVERVRALNERLDGFRVLAGSEVNINTDGSLDYDGRRARGARLGRRLGAHVVPHGRAGDDRAHDGRDGPPARGRDRPSDRAARSCAASPTRSTSSGWSSTPPQTGTMLEINANPDRRDLNDMHARLAAEAGVMIVIDSDAHSAAHAGVIRYGVATARRGMADQGARRQHAHAGSSSTKLRKRGRAAG